MAKRRRKKRKQKNKTRRTSKKRRLVRKSRKKISKKIKKAKSSRTSLEVSDDDGKSVFKVSENWSKPAYVNTAKYQQRQIERVYFSSLRANK